MGAVGSSPHPERFSSPVPPTTVVTYPQNSGFLGGTSSLNIFGNARDTLSRLNCSRINISGHRMGEPVNLGIISHETDLSHFRGKAISVLRALGTVSDVPIRPWSDYPHHNWAWEGARAILCHLRQQQGRYLRRTARDAELEEFVSTISQNTARPFSDHLDEAQMWNEQFIGRNLRWESIGLVFAYFLPSSLSASTATGLDMEKIQRCRGIAVACNAYCISLARHFSAANSVLLRLCLNRAIEESKITGDAAFPAWNALSESTAMLTFLGFHAEMNTNSYLPSYASEIRRRITAHAFSLDKISVLCTGRPPQLGRRYFSTPLPLDLSDEDLRGDRQTRLRAFACLNSAGWNTDGQIRPATQLRARLMMSLIRDELIEIALGYNFNANTQGLLDIRQRQLDLFDNLPACLKLQEQKNSLRGAVRAKEARVFVHMEHLLNLFFTERLLQRQGYHGDGRLLAISFDLLVSALLFWEDKDTNSRSYSDLPWIAMAYATPAGGILCTELLNPSFVSKHPLNGKITRASIIQNLSLLVGFLQWIGPQGLNGNLCANCSSIIQGVLDHVLNSTEPIPSQSYMNASFDFNFDLLNTFDGQISPTNSHDII